MNDRTCDDQLPLPDDLAELASQLADDAEHLTKTYPAGKPDLWEAEIVRSGQPLRRRRSSTWYRGLAAAAAVLIVAPTTWYASGLPWFGEQQPAIGSMPVIDNLGHVVDPSSSRPKYVIVRIDQWMQLRDIFYRQKEQSAEKDRLIETLRTQIADIKAQQKKAGD